MKYHLKKILLSNWLICTILTAGIIAGMLVNFYPLQFIEHKAYDSLCRLRSSSASDAVVVVKIDDDTLRVIGAPPWPRSIIAEAVNQLSDFNPKVMAIQLLFSGPEINPALSEIQDLRTELRTEIFPKNNKNRNKVDQLLSDAAERLDHDAELISAINYSVNAVLPVLFTTEPNDMSVTSGALPDWLVRHSLENQRFQPRRVSASAIDSLLYLRPGDQSISVFSVIPTYEHLARKASALGHINMAADRDGTTRKVPLFIEYRDRYFPSFALQVAARYLKADLRDIQRSDAGISLKNANVPTDGAFQMLIDCAGIGRHLQRISFADVYNGNVTADMFEGKIVLLGEELPGRTPRYRSAGYDGLSNIDITFFSNQLTLLQLIIQVFYR